MNDQEKANLVSLMQSLANHFSEIALNGQHSAYVRELYTSIAILLMSYNPDQSQ